jgi:hypothetical protein
MRIFLSAVLAAVLLTIAGCAATGGSTGKDSKVPGEGLVNQPAPVANAGLDATTAVVFGAGQTGTITLTDQAVIRSLVHEMTGGKVVAKPDAPATAFFAWFKAGDQQVAQLWMLREQATSDVLAVRLEGESDWRAVAPGLNGLLKPILNQVPGPKMP